MLCIQLGLTIMIRHVLFIWYVAGVTGLDTGVTGIESGQLE